MCGLILFDRLWLCLCCCCSLTLEPEKPNYVMTLYFVVCVFFLFILLSVLFLSSFSPFCKPLCTYSGIWPAIAASSIAGTCSNQRQNWSNLQKKDRDQAKTLPAAGSLRLVWIYKCHSHCVFIAVKHKSNNYSKPSYTVYGWGTMRSAWALLKGGVGVRWAEKVGNHCHMIMLHSKYL